MSFYVRDFEAIRERMEAQAKDDEVKALEGLEAAIAKSISELPTEGSVSPFLGHRERAIRAHAVTMGARALAAEREVDACRVHLRRFEQLLTLAERGPSKSLLAEGFVSAMLIIDRIAPAMNPGGSDDSEAAKLYRELLKDLGEAQKVE